ncbi:MAG: hypothetical protein ACLPZR_08680, partial [Solirubrobacteraceae bacterium]
MDTDAEADELIDSSKCVAAQLDGFRGSALLERVALRELILRFALLLRSGWPSRGYRKGRGSRGAGGTALDREARCNSCALPDRGVHVRCSTEQLDA